MLTAPPAALLPCVEPADMETAPPSRIAPSFERIVMAPPRPRCASPVSMLIAPLGASSA